MAGPTFRGFDFGNSTSTTIPSGTAAGDLLMAILRFASSDTPAVPSADWTQVGSVFASGTDQFICCYATYSVSLSRSYTSSHRADYVWGYQVGTWGIPLYFVVLTNQSATTAPSITLGFTPNAGDGLLGAIIPPVSSATTGTPSGWTSDHTSTSGSQFHKTAAGTETTVATTFASSQQWCGVVVDVPGPAVEVDLTVSAGGTGSLSAVLSTPATITASAAGTGGLAVAVSTPAQLAATMTAAASLAAPVSTPVLLAASSSAQSTLSSALYVPFQIGPVEADGQSSLTALLTAPQHVAGTINAPADPAGTIYGRLEATATIDGNYASTATIYGNAVVTATLDEAT